VLCPDGEGVYVSRKLSGAARAYVKSVGSEVAPVDCALIMRTEAASVTREVLSTDITSLAKDWRDVKVRPWGVSQIQTPFEPLLCDRSSFESYEHGLTRLTRLTVSVHKTRTPPPPRFARRARPVARRCRGVCWTPLQLSRFWFAICSANGFPG